MCIASIRIAPLLFLHHPTQLFLQIVHFTLYIVSMASIWSGGHKSGVEVTWQS